MQIHVKTQGKTKNRRANSPTVWTPPPSGFLKINFDGASRGNPRPAGFGVVLRDHTSKIIHMMESFLGENKNNVEELTRLVRGLQDAIQH